MNHWPLTVLHSLAALSKLFIPIVLVRVFTLEQLGTYKLFFLYLYLAPEMFMIAGASSGLGHWVGQKDKRNLLCAASWVVIISSIFATILVFSLSQTLHEPFSSYYVNLALALHVLLLLPRLFFEEMLIALGHIWASARFRLIGELVRAIALVSTAVYTRNLEMTLMASAIFSLLELKLYAAFVIKERLLLPSLLAVKYFKKIFSYILPLTLAGLAIVAFDRCDQFLLSRIISAEEFALYSIGCLVVPPLFILEQSITRLLIPALSNSRNDNSWLTDSYTIYRRSIAQIAFWMIPSALFLIVFSDPIVHLLFTENYAKSADYLKLFAIIYVLMSFPYDVVPRALGESRWIMKTYLASGLVSIFNVYTLGSAYGAIGALSGLLLTQLLVRAYGTLYAANSFNVSLLKLVPIYELARIITCAMIGLFFSLIVLYSGAYPLATVILGIILFSAGFLLTWAFYPIKTSSHQHKEIRVLQITQFLIAGGLEKLVVDLAVRLNDPPRWRSFVVSYDAMSKSKDSYLYKKLLQSGVDVQLLQKQNGICFITISKLFALIARERIDVIHTHDLGSLIYGVLAKLCSAYPPLLVHTQHSFVHLERKSRYKIYERIFTWFADIVVPVSQSLEETYVKLGLPAAKLKVVPNGVNFNEVYKEPSLVTLKSARAEIVNQLSLSSSDKTILAASEFWIIYVARIHPGKGQIELLKIWQLLNSNLRSKSAIVFVGNATCDLAHARLKKEISKTSNSERIILAGHTSDPSVWYQSATVAVSCSEFEGHPLVPIEAVGHGSAFLASDIAGHRYISKIATLYPLGNASAGAAALSALILSSEKYPNEWFSERHRLLRKVRRDFSFEHTLREYKRLYSRISGQNTLTSRQEKESNETYKFELNIKQVNYR